MVFYPGRFPMQYLSRTQPRPDHRARALIALLALLLIAALGSAHYASATAAREDEPIPAPSVAIGADALHERGIDGAGVTVAIVDTGLAPLGEKSWQRQADGSLLLPAKAKRGFVVYRDFVAPTGDDSGDPNGHGTHVVGSISNGRGLLPGKAAAMGVAPGANLVVARALGDDGSGSYDQMIAAIDWIIAVRATYGIRVLNLSVYAPIVGPYWDDPLAQAVMRAWQAGIVVVVAAGNGGPGPATVTTPGNVPYVISVGALHSGNFSADGRDRLAAFSSRGPTESAFAKPDVLAPAVRVLAPMPDDSALGLTVLAGRLREKGELEIGAAKAKKLAGYYQLSGTSMAAAEVSGLAALVLQAQPALTNDQVKYRLMATSRLALADGGAAAYSIWEQGSGLVQATAAVDGATTASANTGLDLAADLDPARDLHGWGMTTYDPVSGTFRMEPLPTTPSGYLVWGGGSRAWTGSTWSGDPDVWAGASRAWTGASRAWTGAGNTWYGDMELWAGASRAWTGTNASSLTSRANTVIGEYTARLPLVIR
jgi:serine protease AprX